MQPRSWTFDLQRFSEAIASDPTQTPDTVPANPPAPAGEPAAASSAPGSDPAQGASPQKMLSQEDVDRIIARRLAEDRQRRGGRNAPAGDNPWVSFGQQIETHPDADTLRAELQEVVNRRSQIDPVTAAARTVQSFEQRTELRLAEVEMRSSDPVFKANEAVIKDWAEENGITVDSPAHLRMATLAWKGANATQIAANAQVEAQRAAQAAASAKAAGNLVAGGGTRQPAPDTRKMSDAEWLKANGLNWQLQG